MAAVAASEVASEPESALVWALELASAQVSAREPGRAQAWVWA